jgi:hypothetical protein
MAFQTVSFVFRMLSASRFYLTAKDISRHSCSFYPYEDKEGLVVEEAEGAAPTKEAFASVRGKHARDEPLPAVVATAE